MNPRICSARGWDLGGSQPQQPAVPPRPMTRRLQQRVLTIAEDACWNPGDLLSKQAGAHVLKDKTARQVLFPHALRSHPIAATHTLPLPAAPRQEAAERGAAASCHDFLLCAEGRSREPVCCDLKHRGKMGAAGTLGQLLLTCAPHPPHNRGPGPQPPVSLSGRITFRLCPLGCHGGTDRDMAAVTVALDWKPNTNHTGFYVARAKGYYADAGLDVTIRSPHVNGYTSTPGAHVADGSATFACCPSETVIRWAAGRMGAPMLPHIAIWSHAKHARHAAAPCANPAAPRLLAATCSYHTWPESAGGPKPKIQAVATLLQARRSESRRSRQPRDGTRPPNRRPTWWFMLCRALAPPS